MHFYCIPGNTQLLDGGAMFGNAPKEMWKAWTPVDEKNRIPLACNALLVQIEGKNILFEAGVGAFFEPKLKDRYGVQETEHILLKNLEKNGFSQEDIHAVVLSHLHFDHAGGLLSAYEEGKTPQLLFPQARFYISKEHWQRALKPHPRDRASFLPVLHDLLLASGRLELVERTEHPDLSPHVTFSFTQGHTPGLMHGWIHEPGQGPLVFASDLIPGRAWVHVPLSMGYDRYPELVIEEKQQLLTQLLQKKGRLFLTHEIQHPFVNVAQDEKGKFYGAPCP